jgi:hypothetical protein
MAQLSGCTSLNNISMSDGNGIRNCDYVINESSASESVVLFNQPPDIRSEVLVIDTCCLEAV